MNAGIYHGAESRFFAKVVEVDGCWLWTASRRGDGYGQFGRGPARAGNALTHRWSWEFFRGPIPDGLQLDHLCRNRACVNPDHLEPVTSRINTLRGLNQAAVNARKTHCPGGHEYDAGNTYTSPDGERKCRACCRSRERQRRAAARIAA